MTFKDTIFISNFEEKKNKTEKLIEETKQKLYEIWKEK